jgi:hypothetical protein
MVITPSQLRQNIYRLLDRVCESGLPIDIKCKGKMLRIALLEKTNKLDDLKERPCIVGDPQEIVEIDWSRAWSNDLS